MNGPPTERKTDEPVKFGEKHKPDPNSVDGFRKVVDVVVHPHNRMEVLLSDNAQTRVTWWCDYYGAEA